MIYIILGLIAFVCLFIFDIYTLKNKLIFKRVFGIIGVGLFVYSVIKVLIESKVIINPSYIVKIGSGFFCAIFTFLLIYSLFLELPFIKTYGKNQHNNKLVDTGTYALCRHPGVLWFGFAFLFLFLTTGRNFVIYAGIIWTVFDILYVYLQEKYIFNKMFPEYYTYKKTTPMLIPTRKSTRKCFLTLFNY